MVKYSKQSRKRVVNKLNEVYIMKTIKELLDQIELTEEQLQQAKTLQKNVFKTFNKVDEKPCVGDTYGLCEYPIVRVHEYGEGYYRIHTLDLNGNPTVDNIFYVYCEGGK